MERRCPHCGKLTQVSDEELALHGNVVVCPQCLTVFDVDGVLLTAEEARRRRQPADSAVSMRYCPACGSRLQMAMNFCPNCGMRLQLHAEEPMPVSVVHNDAAVSTEPGRDAMPVVEDAEEEDGRLHIPFMPYRFKNSGFEALFPKPKASKRTQAVAYTIILLLLALLVAIIVAAYKI